MTHLGRAAVVALIFGLVACGDDVRRSAVGLDVEADRQEYDPDGLSDLFVPSDQDAGDAGSDDLDERDADMEDIAEDGAEDGADLGDAQPDLTADSTNDGTDANEDTRLDATEDTSLDATEDTSLDAAEDTGLDATEDTGLDSTEDASLDAAEDASGDTGDLPLDTGGDSTTDMGEDTGLSELDPSTLPSPPYLMWVTQHAISVRWETEDAEAGIVHYGTTTATENLRQEDAAVTVHEVRLDGLQTATKYYYRVQVGESVTPVRSFTTAPTDDTDTTVRFVVWGDNQNGPANFTRIAPLMSAEEPDFAISTGDCVQNGTRDEYREQLFQPIAPLADHVAFLVGVGNHEYYSSPGIELYREYMSQPGDEHCFGWRYGPLFFLMLDSDRDLKDDSAQAECISTALTSDAATTAAFRIAAYHRPPRVRYWVGSWITYLAIAKPAVRDWLEPELVSLGVDLVFNGHNHLYQHSVIGSGMTYFTTGGGGGGLDTDSGWNFLRNWDEIQTELYQHHFLSVEADLDEMTVTAINIDGDVIDTVVIAAPD